MNLGKGRLKLAVSMKSRRLRLGVSHQGSAGSWVAPTKDRDERHRPGKQKRR